MRVGGRGSLFPLVAVVSACAALIASAGASAATIVNGGFETGNFQGWQLQRQTEAGQWFVYQGTTTPFGTKRSPVTKVPLPPQGNFAAMADQANPESLILWQDIALEPGLPHKISLQAYYRSYGPLAIPVPDTLSVSPETIGEAPNQQFRIDLIRPEAPIDSLNSADILKTIFASRPQDPQLMGASLFSANLDAFAGQTVRLRVAVAATEEILNAGVDAVSVDGSDPGKGGVGATKLGFGRSAKNRKKGTVTLSVRVPGPGTLTAAGPGKAKPKRIATTTSRPKAAKTVRLTIKPTPVARRTLQAKHRLRVPVSVRYVSQTGAVETANRPVVLELRARHHRR